MVAINKPRFPLGQVVATPAALEALKDSGQSANDFIHRHAVLDQGELCDEDHQANNDSLLEGGRVLSSFLLRDGETKLWLITEADRSSTTILLPDEY